jgi:hypothetical protein
MKCETELEIGDVCIELNSSHSDCGYQLNLEFHYQLSNSRVKPRISVSTFQFQHHEMSQYQIIISSQGICSPPSLYEPKGYFSVFIKSAGKDPKGEHVSWSEDVCKMCEDEETVGSETLCVDPKFP